MNRRSRFFWIIFTVIILIILICAGYVYKTNQDNVASINICQDDELVIKLIEQNINPFSKFKFIKKRNSDCNILLKENKEDAIKSRDEKYCSILDSSTNSIILLVNTYVHEMYDRESASKEFRNTTPLMTPYDYCPQYIDNMIDLIQLKKRLGL